MRKYRIVVLLVSMVLMVPLSEYLRVRCLDVPAPSTESAEYVDKVVPQGGESAVAAVPDGYVPEVVRPYFGGVGYIVGCCIVLLVFILLLALATMSGMVMIVPVLLISLFTFAGAAVLFALGYFAVSLASGIVTLAVYIGVPAIIAALYLVVFFARKRKTVTATAANSVRRSASATAAVRYDFKVLYGAMMVSLVIAVIALCAGKPTQYIMVPLALSCTAVLLWRILKWRGFMLLGFLAIELFYLLYCVPLVSSAAAGWFWPILVVTLLHMSVMTPLADLYCHREMIA